MKIRNFDVEQWLPLPREELFPFFGNAANLGEITPDWLHFHILTPMPVEMKAGTLLDYRLLIHGIPVRWRTEIVEWDPPYRFVDRQTRGPYQQWIHTHTFEPKDGGTLMRDHVEYAVPGWFLEPIVNRWLVAPDIKKIFAYRKAKIEEILVKPRTQGLLPNR